MVIGRKAGACPHRDGRTCAECERLPESARMLLRRMTRLSELTPSTAIPALPRLAYGGRLTLLAGRESSGKSTLLRVAVACASIGRDWMTDAPIQPVPAIWIGEERRDDIEAEFTCFEELQMDQDLVRVASVADVQDVSDLHDVVRSIGAKVVVIDPVADLVNVRTAGSTYREMRQALLALRPLEPDVAVIGVLHSARRSTDSVSSYIGSAGQGGACDLLLDFTNPQQCGDDSYRLLKVSKSRCRAAQVQGTLYPLSFDGLRYREADEPRAPTRGKDVPTEADVRAYLRENRGTGKTATARHFGITPGVGELEDSAEFWSSADHKMLWCWRHRQTNSVPVCSPASRRVAPLRPRCRGAYGLDPGSAHARPDWLLSDDAQILTPTCCGRRRAQNSAVSGAR